MFFGVGNFDFTFPFTLWILATGVLTWNLDGRSDFIDNFMGWTLFFQWKQSPKRNSSSNGVSYL